MLRCLLATANVLLDSLISAAVPQSSIIDRKAAGAHTATRFALAYRQTRGTHPLSQQGL